MPGACGTNGSTFPTFERGCTNSTSCSFGVHQLNCCGSTQAIGFNHSQRDAFDMAEANWRLGCPACGCAAAPLIDDQGVTCTTADPTVSCDSGMCHTHCM
jgi:hypothetical protein